MLVALLKPDVITSGHTDDVVTAIEEEGFTVVEQDLRMITLATAQELYMEHEDKDFYDDVVRYLCSGPVMALLLSKPGDAIGAFRDLMGPTNAERARAEAPDSLRARFGVDGMKNAVHGSSDAGSAAREIRVMFPLAVPSGPVAAVSDAPTGELVEVITAGLSELSRVRPDNPEIWLANWMRANRDHTKRH